MEHISSSPSQYSRVAFKAAHESRYLAPEPAEAIMWEQMEYLMAHAGSSCHPDCPDCTRLKQVKRHLLQPFLNEKETERYLREHASDFCGFRG